MSGDRRLTVSCTRPSRHSFDQISRAGSRPVAQFVGLTAGNIARVRYGSWSFNLDQQKELFRDDALTPRRSIRAADSMIICNCNWWIIVFAEPGGQVSCRRSGESEYRRQSVGRRDLLGRRPVFDRFRIHLSAAAPRFFYLQYKPFYGRGRLSGLYRIRDQEGARKANADSHSREFAKAIKARSRVDVRRKLTGNEVTGQEACPTYIGSLYASS